MKNIIKIIVFFLFLFISNNISAQTLLFSDNFATTNFISVYSNIIVNTNAVVLPFTNGILNGFIVSTIITKATNETWAKLNVQYLITNNSGIPANSPTINL